MEENIRNYLKIKIKHLTKEFSFFSKQWSFNSDVEIHASLKSFEILFELTFKTLKKLFFYYEDNNLISSHECLRWAGNKNLIKPEPWFYFLKLRNRIVHDYFDEDEDIEFVEELKNIFPSFSANLKDVIVKFTSLLSS
jgi:uncharacterized protein YutE (UPF0331/DUF86 family)